MRQQQQQPMWQLLINAFHVFLLTAAKATITPTATTSLNAATMRAAYRPLATAASDDLWEHVNKTCLSRACNETLNVQHLHQLQRNMRWDLNPCDDFHAYACGNWQREHHQARTMMQVADEALNERYVQLFERALQARQEAAEQQQTHRLERTGRGHAFGYVHKLHQQSHADREPLATEHNLVFAKMLHYYSVCKHSSALAPPTLRGYYEQLRNEGVLRARGQHWQELLALLGRYGFAEQFVRMEVKQLNASQHVIMVAPHDRCQRLDLSADIYEILREHTHIEYRVLASQFQRLEVELHEIINGTCVSPCPGVATAQELEEDDCDLVATYTFDELSHTCRDIDWQQFIGIQMNRAIHRDELIRVDSLETVCKLARYLNQAEHSGLYFLYTLARFLNYLQQQPYNVVHVGVSSANCVRHMRKTLNLPMTYLYERLFYSHVRAESDRVIRSIFAQLKAEFARTLALNKMQLDADIVVYLQEKLLALRLNIGNLPADVGEHFYIEYVRQLNVSGNLYRNHLHALQHTYAQQRQLATASSRCAWHSFNFHDPHFPDNLEATPYYFCLSNMIIIPHAYLQLPFYDEHFWPVLLYGDLANTLGHELMHNFDSNFIMYDYAGNMADIYERIKVNPNFSRGVACLAEGTELLSERIADISGTRLALNTFLSEPQFLQRNGKLFFLQFAQFFCGASDLATHQQHDPTHDLDRVRLNYALSHMPEFASVYNCPAGSAMHPLKRCELW